MPNKQTAVVSNYDFGAPNVEAAVLGFRVRADQGGVVEVLVESDISNDNSITYSLQVAPADANDQPGTFVDTAAATNLEAVVDVVVAPGTNRSHRILLRPGIDRFLLVAASGGARGRVQLRQDAPLDLWRTAKTVGAAGGIPDLTPA